jgi:hypothetical protein
MITSVEVAHPTYYKNSMDKIIPRLNVNDNKKKAFYALCYAIFALTIDSISTPFEMGN